MRRSWIYLNARLKQPAPIQNSQPKMRRESSARKLRGWALGETTVPMSPSPSAAHRIREVAALFLRLGATSFGGPAAHIALLENEVVRRRGWLTSQQFLDYLGATNLIPGPNSTEMAIHIGHARAGWPGLVVAGVSFIAPATVLITAAAWAYVRYGEMPVVSGLLYGIKPVVMAVVGQALWSLGRTALKNRGLIALAFAVAVAVSSGVHELTALAGAGAVAGMAHLGSRLGGPLSGMALVSAGTATVSVYAVGGPATGAAAFGLLPLFAVFAKAGAVLYGSGYVLLAFLRADLVDRLGWMSEPQLLEAIAIGQMMPGPVFTTATFIGYLLGGLGGAAAATIGIFFPAFIFVALSGPLVPRLRQSRVAGAVLDGVNAASLALMATASWALGSAALVDPVTAILGLSSLIALTRFRVNSAWVMAAGGFLGIVAQWLRQTGLV